MKNRKKLLKLFKVKIFFIPSVITEIIPDVNFYLDSDDERERNIRPV